MTNNGGYMPRHTSKGDPVTHLILFLLDSDQQYLLKMTHECTISFSKTKRIDSEDIRATLLKLSLSYTLLVQCIQRLCTRCLNIGTKVVVTDPFPNFTPNTILYYKTLHYYCLFCRKIAVIHGQRNLN